MPIETLGLVIIIGAIFFVIGLVGTHGLEIKFLRIAQLDVLSRGVLIILGGVLLLAGAVNVFLPRLVPGNPPATPLPIAIATTALMPPTVAPLSTSVSQPPTSTAIIVPTAGMPPASVSPAQALRICVIRPGGPVFDARGQGIGNAGMLALEALVNGTMRAPDQPIDALLTPGNSTPIITQLREVGFEVQPCEENDLSSPQRAAAIARGLVADPTVRCVVGHYNSASSLAAGGIYASPEKRVPMVVVGSTNPEVVLQGETIWRLNANDNLQGSAAYRLAYEQRTNNRLAVVRVANEPFSNGVFDAFQKALAADSRADKPVISATATFTRPASGGNTANFAEAVREIQRSERPGLIFFIGTETELATFLSQLGKEYQDVPIFGVSLMDNPEIIDTLRDEGWRISYTAVAMPFEPEKNLMELWFSTTYWGRFGNAKEQISVPSYAAETYDGFYVCARAVLEAVRVNGSAITPGDVANALRSLVERGEHFDRGPHATATGPYILDTATRELRQSVIVLRENDDKWKSYLCDLAKCDLIPRAQRQ